MPEFLKPWRMALPLLGLLFLGALWSGYWMWASSRAHTHVASWRQEWADKGVRITCGQESWGGYPFRIAVRCTPGVIATNTQSVAFSELTIMAQAYDLRHILIINDGDTTIGSDPQPMRITHEGAIASLLLGKKGQAQLDIEFKIVAGEQFTAERIAFNTRLGEKDAAENLDIAAAFEMATFTMGAQPVTIDSFTLHGNVAPVPNAITLEGIAQQGSVITLTGADVQSAAIRYRGAGEVKIGPDARPQGNITGRIQNFDHVLQSLSDRGLLQEEARMGAGAVLGLLGGNSPEGMRIDIAAQQGGLYIGPFRIADLPPLF